MPSPLQDYVTYWMHRMYHLPSLYRDTDTMTIRMMVQIGQS